ncbi:MAG: LUD domain-containing protein [Deltaproteobacteria bacterium]|nr:MAG: LUD domain-containing protein [Deltaproteobacteria bacterium]
MNTSGQNEFITKVKTALGYALTDERQGLHLLLTADSLLHTGTLEKINARTKDDHRKLLDTLIEQGKPINLNVIPQKDVETLRLTIKELVRDKNPEWGGQKSVVAWKHPLIQKLNLPQYLADEKVPVHYTTVQDDEADPKALAADRAKIRQLVVDSYIGITSADYCLADTATLVMKARAGQARSVSLVPSVHIAIIELEQIIADLKELYILLKRASRKKFEDLSNCMTFISGPSKTGDIELTMVHGAHGPRELYLFVITG